MPVEGRGSLNSENVSGLERLASLSACAISPVATKDIAYDIYAEVDRPRMASFPRIHDQNTDEIILSSSPTYARASWRRQRCKLQLALPSLPVTSGGY